MSTQWSRFVRVALLAMVVVAVGLVWRERAEFQPAHLKALIDGNAYAPLIFIAIHIAASLLFVPRTPLSIASGLLFGLWWGTLWAVCGAMSGSLAGFALARYVNAGWIKPDRMPKLGELLARVERGGWRAVALIRIVPIMPHTPVNYAFGLSRVTLGDYLLGSLIGQLPITVFCVDVGSAGGQALTGSMNWLEPTLVGVGALALSLVLPKLASLTPGFAMTEIYRFTEGRVPVLVSMPHVGTGLMPGLAERLTEAALPLGDTDWHLPQLYDFLGELGCSTLVATHSRFVVDLNRPPDDKPLYAGATTGLIPDITFDGIPAYRPGTEPDADDRKVRLESYWRPYHHKIEAELARLVAAHGKAVLLDAHSIRGHVPRLFEGRLPDFNIGTADGKSCAVEIGTRSAEILGSAEGYTAILNGKFKGGHITRHYGDPARGRHAIQLELVQETYMDVAAPYGFRPDLAAGVRTHLKRFVAALVEWAKP